MEPGSVLKKFDLTDAESKIYLDLLRFGESTAPEIVKRIKFYKATVYNALSNLERKGLVTHMKRRGREVYSPESPKKFFEMLEEKKSCFESVFPLLEKMHTSKSPKREVRVIDGMEGLKAYFSDVCEVGGELYTVGSALQMIPVMKHRAMQFLNKFKKEGISAKAIFVDKSDVRELASGLSQIFPIAKVRFYPEEYFSTVSFATYGDRLTLLTCSDEPLVVIIRDQRFADAFRKFFEMIWLVSRS
ncbi:MAG: helix-turn-helix domain-containing protein [Candidatus Aenigmarchaeota archaeon]|nr:helix-turn-helix domain-containing protein [Candidatus Aenigmarchaeota archaeon]